MNKLVSILTGGLAVWIIVFYLIPLLPAPIHAFVMCVVVMIAIVFFLGLLTDYKPTWWK